MLKTVYEYTPDGTEYSTFEKARERIMEETGIFDMEDLVGFNITIYDLLQELSRLNSPLFEQLYYETVESKCEDYICTYEVEDDDDEED